MTDAFESFINGMSEADYENFIDNEATDAQKDKALNIRESLSEQELILIQREQDSGIRQVEVYDARDLPPTEKTVDIEQRVGEPIQIRKPEIETQQELERIAPTIKKKSLRERLLGFLSRFRRKKK